MKWVEAAAGGDHPLDPVVGTTHYTGTAEAVGQAQGGRVLVGALLQGAVLPEEREWRAGSWLSGACGGKWSERSGARSSRDAAVTARRV